MKKPILLLKTETDFVKFALCLALCLGASMLFLLPEKSVAVFSQNSEYGVKGLFTLLKSLCF